jgi:hypothetical protein
LVSIMCKMMNKSSIKKEGTTTRYQQLHRMLTVAAFRR